MRDPARIDRMLALLREVWLRNPDYRLGQLIVNAINPTEPCRQIFFLEDQKLEKLLTRVRDGKRSEPTKFDGL